MKTHFCQHCYAENPRSSQICSVCSNVITESSLIEKEQRMQDFTNFLLMQYRVQDTGRAIGLHDFDVKKGRASYDFGRARFSLKSFLLRILHIPSLIEYLISLTQKQLWKARFNELGFLEDLRNNLGLAEREVVEDYREHNAAYHAFSLQNPKRVAMKYGSRAWRILIIIGVIVGIVMILAFAFPFIIGLLG